jgi:predicted ATPase
LRLVQDLVRALAADVEARDDRQRDELLRLRARVDAVQSQARQWFAAAENDVKALYTAFGTRDLGGDR